MNKNNNNEINFLFALYDQFHLGVAITQKQEVIYSNSKMNSLLHLTTIENITQLSDKHCCINEFEINSLRYQIYFLDENTIFQKQALENNNQFRNNFMARISHELKTPLNGVMGMVELLVASELNSEQRDYLDTIKKSSIRLLKLVNNMLEYEQVENGKFEINQKNISIKDRIEKITNHFLPLAVNKKLKFQIENKLNSDQFYCDGNRIFQVVNYLVDNAIKVTSNGRVEILFYQNTLSELIIEVRDTGPGIPEERRPFIFSPFISEIHSNEDDYNGLGLSLATSANIVKCLNGTIGFKTSLGNGSMFWVKIPIDKVLENSNQTNIRNLENRNKNNLKALIVEDDIINQKILKKMLNKLEIYPEIVSNGLEALEIQSESKFDLIFMDINMPIMDGLESTKRMRERPSIYGNPYIIAVTANSIVGDEDQCYKVGMDNYLPKPFNRERVRNILAPIFKENSFINKDKVDNKLKYYLGKMYDDFKGDEDILNEYVLSIVNKLPEKIEKLEKDLYKNNFKSIEINAHGLKGIMSSVYHEELRRLCEDIEVYGKEKKPRNIYPLFIELKTGLNKFIEELSVQFIDKAS